MIVITATQRRALVALLLFGAGCFQEKKKPQAESGTQVAAAIPTGRLEEVARNRGLTEQQLVAAAKTYVPTGAQDQYLGILSTGSSGRMAVFAMPSMRILKYVGVFSREPWQGYAYDDESKAVLADSARDEIAYDYGDSGAPALSMTGGQYDGAAAFLADGANGRLAVIDLEDYETKQILTNPIFRMTHGDAVVTPDGEYVVQTASAPQIPGNRWVEPAAAQASMRGGLTLWRFVKPQPEQHAHLDARHSFTLELPPYVQGRTRMGKGATDGYAFTIGACAGAGVMPGGESCAGPASHGVLHVTAWRRAAAAAAQAQPVSGHPLITLAAAVKDGLVKQIELGAGPEAVAVSPDGTLAAVTYRFGGKVDLIDLKKAVAASAGNADAFGVLTLPASDVLAGQVEVGGPAADAVFAGDGNLYVTVNEPGKLVRIDVAGKTVTAAHELGFAGGRLAIPGADTATPEAKYAVVMNKRPHGRFVSVGPVNGLNAQLLDISGTAIEPLYDMSVPQANDLSAAIHKAGLNKPVVKYKVGTDTRSGQLSPYGTLPGKERVERKGKRVQVFGTLIRSHITPEIVEVDEGDIVTFHLTNLEQAQDQTHGFTVDTYDVHGSWEPGKTASVTFIADRPGVFPYYCTEFCSALHLEMEGYLLVKPKGYKGPGTNLTAGGESSAEAKAAYEAKMKVITDTQAVIDSVVKWLQENDYTRDARAKAAAEDALEQLGRTKEIQPKIDSAVQASDWDTALLWAEQYFQYQVKCADAGLRAKKILSEGGNQ